MADNVRIGSGSIVLMPDATRFRTMAEQDLRKIQLMHRVNLTPNIAGDYRRLAEEKLAAVKLIHRVNLSPRLEDGFRRDAKEKIDAALAGVGQTVTLNLALGTELASRQMGLWRREQEARPLRIRVVTEHVGGTATGRQGPASAEHLGGRFAASNGILLPVSMDQGAMRNAERELDKFSLDEFGDGHGRGPRRDPNRFKISPDVRNDPATRQRLRQQSYEFADAFRLRIQPNLAGLQLRLPLGGLGIAAIPEMISQVGGLVSAMTQLSQVGLLLPGIFGGIGAAVATAAVGMTGLKGAWKALETQEKYSNQTALQQIATRRELTNAVNDEQRARRQLTDAVANEQRRQRDLQLQLKGSRLTEAEAVLAVQDSIAALREGHFANQREYDHALLSFEESKQNLLEVRNHNSDLAADVAKNERTGVLGSDQVLSATQAMQQATERVAQATERLAEGGTAMGSATQKAQEAMGKLAPSAREFIQTLFDTRPAMRQFAQSVQQNLFTNLGPAFSTLFNSPAIQQNLRTGMQGLATQLNAVTRTTFANLGSPKSGDLITRIFGNTTDSTKRFNDQVVTPLTFGIERLTAAGSASLPRITDAMGVIARRFDNFVDKADKDGSLKKWVDQGLDAFTQVGRIVGNLYSSLQGISRAFGGTFLTNIDTLSAKLATFLNSARGQQDLTNFILQTKAAFDSWKPILADIPSVLKVAFDTGRTAISAFLPMIQLMADLISTYPGLTEAVVTAFVAWKTISPVITGVQTALDGVGRVMTTVGTIGQGNFGVIGQAARRSAGEVDAAFKGTAREGGAIHQSTRAVQGLAGALSLGGPLAGAILGGILLVIDQWISKEEEATQVTAGLRREQEQLADTLDRTTGLITEQTRQSQATSFTDFKPQDKNALSGNALQAAIALGVGGANGSDLVTASLPGAAGAKAYGDITGQLHTLMRPWVAAQVGNIDLRGLTIDDITDAFLGKPEALAKFRESSLSQGGGFNLTDLARTAQIQGGPALQAALVGQALNERRFQSGPATAKQQALRAAQPQVSLNAAGGIFGHATASYGNGQYKIVSDTAPSDPKIAPLLKDNAGSITPEQNPAGAEYAYTYTLSREQALRYMNGVPTYGGGGPSKAGLAILHEPEFVIAEPGARKYPQSFLHDVSQGKLDLDELPHYDDGGPFPDPLHGPIGGPNLGDVLHPGASPIPTGAGAPQGQIPGIGGIGRDPLSMFTNWFGGGSGKGGSGGPPSLASIAERFGKVLMTGVLGFFGINPQYLNDIDKVVNFGLSKAGSTGIDPNAQANIAQDIVGYDQDDGSPIYYLPTGQTGTALPGLTGAAAGPGGAAAAGNAAGPVGLAAGSASGTTPGGQTIGTNPASRANFGGASPPDITPKSLQAAGIAPLYSWNAQTRAAPATAVPGWVQDLAKQFGLTAATYSTGGSLHEGGYAFDFNDPDSPGGDSPKLDAFAGFVQQHLAGQTLQLIHANPSTGQKWGVAAGTTVGVPGSAAPNYFSGDFSGHYDHVHWATDVPIAVGPAVGNVAPWTIPGSTAGTGTAGGFDQWWGGSYKPSGAPWQPSNAPLGGPKIAPGTPTPTPPGTGDRQWLPGSGGGQFGDSRQWLPGSGGGSFGGQQWLPGSGGSDAPISRRGGKRQGVLYSPTRGVLGQISSGRFAGSQGSASAPEGLSGLKAIAYQLYLASGMPPNEWGDFDQLEQHEAGWDPKAQNPSSTAFGLGQFLDSTWTSVGGRKTDDPQLQLQYMFAYLKQRYHGSPREAWQTWQSRSPHWYDYGGPLPPGLNFTMNATGQDELVMNAQQIQATAAAMTRPIGTAQPADPNRSGAGIPPELMQAIPNAAREIEPRQPQVAAPGGPLPPEQELPPPTAQHEQEPTPQPPGAPTPQPTPVTPSQPSPLPSGAPGAKASTVPQPEPGGRPGQPKIGEAPESTDHELPALKQGVSSAASTMGSLAALAVQAAAAGGTFGASAAAGGAGAGQAGQLISGLFTQGGKIVNSALNVAESALVGTATPGTTDDPYGVAIKGLQAPQNLSPVDRSTHYHGDLYSNNMDDFFHRQELRDSQHMQTQLASKGSY